MPLRGRAQAQVRARLDFTPRDDLPPELVPDADFTRIMPAKAPLLRKLVDGAFKQMFATEKKKQPGGETIYTGSYATSSAISLTSGIIRSRGCKKW